MARGPVPAGGVRYFRKWLFDQTAVENDWSLGMVRDLPRNAIPNGGAYDLKDFFGAQVFQTVIPRNVRLAEAPSYGQPIFLYDPQCRGAASYLELAREVINHDAKGVGARA